MQRGGEGKKGTSPRKAVISDIRSAREEAVTHGKWGHRHTMKQVDCGSCYGSPNSKAQKWVIDRREDLDQLVLRQSWKR